MSLTVRRPLLLLAVGLAALVEARMVLTVPGGLRTGLLAVMIPAALAAAVAPWPALLTLAAVWPLLADTRRTVEVLESLLPPLRGAHDSFLTLPAYPWLPAVVLAGGLVWAVRRLALDRPEPEADALWPALWLWLVAVTVTTLTGVLALNPVFSGVFWAGLLEELWRVPLAFEPEPLAPLGRGHAAAAGLVLLAWARSEARTPERRRALATALITASMLVALSVFAPAGGPRTGVIRETICSAAICLAGFALLLARIRQESATPVRLGLRGLGLAVFVLALWLIGSRLALLLALGLGAGAVIPPRVAAWLRPSGRATVALALMATFVLWPSAPAGLEPAGAPRRALAALLGWLTAGPGQTADVAFTLRADRWPEAWRAGIEHPWWGHGFATAAHGGAPRRWHETAHSQPLQTWVESGVAGLVSLGLLLTAAMRGSAAPARGAITALIVLGLAFALLHHPEMQALLWLLVATLPRSAGPPLREPSATLIRRGLAATGLLSLLVAAFVCWRQPPRLVLIDEFHAASDGYLAAWIRRHADLALDVERPFLLLPLWAGHPDVARRPVGATVSVDGTPVRRGRFDLPGWQMWVLDMRPWLGRRATLSITASRTWTPAAQGSPDARALSFVLGAWEWLDTELGPEPPRRDHWSLPEDAP